MTAGKTGTELLRHSAVYAFAQIVSRLASIVLLPVYTRYLTPGDYAAIALLDVTTGILGTLIGAGIGAALTRYHFDDSDGGRRRRLWWTGLAFVSTRGAAVVVVALLGRGVLAAVVLGPDVENGSLLFALALPNLWLVTTGMVPQYYLRTEKRSTVVVQLALARLALNVTLNLVFLAHFELGPSGILLGNLLASGLFTAIQVALLARSLGFEGIDRTLIPPLWRFGRPLVATALLSMLLQTSDRYLLRFLVDIETLGIYSFAAVIGRSVNTMVLVPFTAIWSVSIYDIAEGPEPESTFAAVFRAYFDSIVLLMFGVAVAARPFFELFTDARYHPAADLVPIVCLAYTMFDLHDQFRVPVLIAKRTSMLLPVFLFAVAVNLIAMLVLVPPLGAAGAAWASVLGFVAFSFGGLMRYRSIACYPYPLGRCGLVLLGVSATFAAYTAWRVSTDQSPIVQLVVGGALCLVVGGILFRREVMQAIHDLQGKKLAERYGPFPR